MRSFHRSSILGAAALALAAGGCTEVTDHGTSLSALERTTRIEAESYARYFDSDRGNTGGACRSGDVDLEVTTDTGGGCNVGWTSSGEWLEYDVDVARTGDHRVLVRVASAESSKRGHVEIDGRNVGSFTAPSSGWQSWTTRTVATTRLTAGRHVIRVVFDTGLLNLNWIELRTDVPDAPVDAGAPVPPVVDSGRPVVSGRANLTNFESYPDPNSEECIEYNGCTWAGQFAAIDGVMSEQWVREHRIAAVHERDFARFKLKTLRLRQGSRTIDVTVYDMCSDRDCNGCCTRNAQQNGVGFLIDIEKYTMQSFGSGSGIVEWTCLDC